MKDLKIEFTEDQIEEEEALTPKKVYEVYFISEDGQFLIVDDNREFLWVPTNECKLAY
jgi:hypothetical protein